MLEWLSGFLTTKEGQVAFTIAVFYSLNAMLTGIKMGLDRIKDKTESKWDNRASEVLGVILGGFSKAIAFLTANTAALPPKVQEEIQKG